MSKKNIDVLQEDTIKTDVSITKKSVKYYSKSQIIRSKKFRDFTDIISVSIKDDELLSVEQAKKRIDDFLKGKVK